VTRLNHVRVAWTDLLLGAVVVGNAHRSRLQDADMPHLTAFASHDRLDALRPSPSGLQRHAGRAHPTHPYDLNLRLVGRPSLIGRVEAACFHTGHRSRPSIAACSAILTLSAEGRAPSANRRRDGDPAHHGEQDQGRGKAVEAASFARNKPDSATEHRFSQPVPYLFLAQPCGCTPAPPQLERRSEMP
jgi:hypothetical protein